VVGVGIMVCDLIDGQKVAIVANREWSVDRFVQGMVMVRHMLLVRFWHNASSNIHLSRWSDDIFGGMGGTCIIR